VGQSPSSSLNRRIRQQAGSYTVDTRHSLSIRRKTLQATSEVTTAANSVGRAPSSSLNRRIRQQAGSYTVDTRHSL
ncbi:MAG: hypothetical protein ACRER8_07085, partial [Pseudomonas sp.]|uniref:hypothetical protein n=1 Tax=Pseudomonas sp. TaxID=306 RepID=UPI003D6EBEA9